MKRHPIPCGTEALSQIVDTIDPLIPTDPLEAADMWGALADVADDRHHEAVATARAAGISWAAIAARFGLRRHSSAASRYTKR